MAHGATEWDRLALRRSRSKSNLLFSGSDAVNAAATVVDSSLTVSLPQPPKVQQKSKEQKMAAAMAGGKGKKKKWSKGKSRDKVDNKVLMSQEQFDRLHAEVPKMKLITVSAVVEKLKISGGLARRALRDLAEEGKIRPVLLSRAQQIYTRNVGDDEE